MSTYQVEEYYLYMVGLCLSEENISAIEVLLSEEGYGDYSFQGEYTEIVIDGIPCESEGDELERKILELF